LKKPVFSTACRRPEHPREDLLQAALLLFCAAFVLGLADF